MLVELKQVFISLLYKNIIRKTGIVLTFFILISSLATAQDSILNRTIFVGDVGYNTHTSRVLLNDAAGNILSDKTNVVLLGNTINTRKLSVKIDRNTTTGLNELTGKMSEFLNRETPVYLLPGSMEWDHSRPGGKKKLEELTQLVNGRGNKLMGVIPQNGCPGPETVDLAPGLVMVVVDDEWWLYPFLEKNNANGCPVKSAEDVINELREMLYRNMDKTILLVTHHPFLGRGRESSNFSAGDYFFPFRELNRNLHLPLPGVGALYPLFKKVFPDAENLRHPDYWLMKKDISDVFDGFPNVVHISSHQDGLQLINDAKWPLSLEVVTGIGDRKPFTKKTDQTLFNENLPGYVIADYMSNKTIRFKFYALKKKNIEKIFEYDFPYKSKKDWNSTVYNIVDGDSITDIAYGKYAQRGALWRFMFGNQYREAWAAPVRLPVLRLSAEMPGLTIRKIGGGKQSTNLRLLDADHTQFVLRSVRKTSERVVASPFRTPFVGDLVSDFFVEQHPYSALIVPPIARATGVPHADPIIAYTPFDTVMERYNGIFAGKINLLERWEPIGATDNFEKASDVLLKDNDNRFDGLGFLRARMLDLIIGDWDRHWDQWRFHYTREGNHKKYIIVPRDRDMALNATDGLLFGIGKKGFLVPKVSGFGANEVKQVTNYLFKSNFMESYPASQISHRVWTEAVDKFARNLTDSVLLDAVNQLPQGLPDHQKQDFYKILRKRREDLPEAMERYYQFIGKIVDIQGTDRKEFVSITDVDGGDALRVLMRKIDKHGKLRDTLMNKIYPRSVTKEIRVYLREDFDSVYIDNPSTTIKLRVIGGKPRRNSHKAYNVIAAKKRIEVYDYQQERYYGDTQRLRKKISLKNENTAFVPVNRFNSTGLNIDRGTNRDNGFWVGARVFYDFQNGFRSDTFATRFNFYYRHAFRTNSNEFALSSEWEKILGQANLAANLNIFGPNYSRNFFGSGNETANNHGYQYYRSYFGLYELNPVLRWDWADNNHFKIGPTIQFYDGKPEKNSRHILNNPGDYNGYNKLTTNKNKVQVGFKGSFMIDKRENRWMSHERIDPENGIIEVSSNYNSVLPVSGFLTKVDFVFLGGVSKSAGSMAQIRPEFIFYQSINPGNTLVLSDRIGGAITAGRPDFYQYAFLGGQGNLLGYRSYRYAGMKSLYNNLVMRWVLADFGNSLIKGQIGLTAFYDAGRVWQANETSDKWHNGIGGGVFLAPAYATVFHFNVGWSKEDGWFPNFNLGFRF